MQCPPPAQGTPHAPQFESLLRRSTQAAPHAVRPVVQPVVVHTPAEQTSPVMHALLQAPQWFGSDVMFTQLPWQSTSPGLGQTGVASGVSARSATSVRSTASMPISLCTSIIGCVTPPSSGRWFSAQAPRSKAKHATKDAGRSIYRVSHGLPVMRTALRSCEPMESRCAVGYVRLAPP